MFQSRFFDKNLYHTGHNLCHISFRIEISWNGESSLDEFPENASKDILKHLVSLIDTSAAWNSSKLPRFKNSFFCILEWFCDIPSYEFWKISNRTTNWNSQPIQVGVWTVTFYILGFFCTMHTLVIDLLRPDARNHWLKRILWNVWKMEKFMKAENSTNPTKIFPKMRNHLELHHSVAQLKKWFLMKWKFYPHYRIPGIFVDFGDGLIDFGDKQPKFCHQHDFITVRPESNMTFLGSKNWLTLFVNQLTWFLFWSELQFIQTIRPHLTSVVCFTLSKAKTNGKIFCA